MTLDVLELHEKWMEDPEYRKEYEALEDEFQIAEALIAARIQAGLTQAQVAKRMNTKQSVIARMEGGRANPSTQTLQKFAAATGTHLHISFLPAEGTPQQSV